MIIIDKVAFISSKISAALVLEEQKYIAEKIEKFDKDIIKYKNKQREY